MHELQDYIDAQYGGPGQGLVPDRHDARTRPAGRSTPGKLAVVMGIEVSKLFDCGVKRRAGPSAPPPQIDQQLDEVYDMGVRQMELVNKFDNALAGVAGDNGDDRRRGQRRQPPRDRHVLADAALRAAHNHESHDRTQTRCPAIDRDAAGRASSAAIARSAAGRRRAASTRRPPHCNARGLTAARRAPRQADDRQASMIFDPDHLSVQGAQASCSTSSRRRGYSRRRLQPLLDARRTPIPRIYRLGGFVTPYAGDVHGLRRRSGASTSAGRDPRFYWGVGCGADMNGFGAQGDPRGARRTRSPTRSRARTAVTVGQQHSRPARLRHQQGRRRALRPLPRLGRGPPPASRASDDRRRPRRAAPRPTCRCGSAPTASRPAAARRRRRLTKRGLAGARLGASPAVAAAARGPAEGPRRAALDATASTAAGWPRP